MGPFGSEPHPLTGMTWKIGLRESRLGSCRAPLGARTGRRSREGPLGVREGGESGDAGEGEAERDGAAKGRRGVGGGAISAVAVL